MQASKCRADPKKCVNLIAERLNRMKDAVDDDEYEGPVNAACRM